MGDNKISVPKKEYEAIVDVQQKSRAKGVSKSQYAILKQRIRREDKTTIRDLTNQLQEAQDLITQLQTQAPQETPTEQATQETAPRPIEHSQNCGFFSFDHENDKVLCSKDFDKRGVIHRVAQSICDMCNERRQARLKKHKEDAVIAEQVACLCRYSHQGEFFCFFGKVPRKLEHGLIMCQSCKDRLTMKEVEAHGIILQQKKYVTCGAQEIADKARGILLYSRLKTCPFQGRWHTIGDCEKAHEKGECDRVKVVQVKM